MRRLVAWLLAVVAFGGCAANAGTHREPGTIVSLTRTDGATMNPLFADGFEDGLVYAQLIYESLTYIGTDYLPHPRLATSWTHSPDGLHWTVELRRGVRWSDGVPFTSKDVVFTYDALTDLKTAAVNYGDMQYIKRTTAEGPYRVRFDLAYPSAWFTLLALGVEASILPAHVLGGIPHAQLRFSTVNEHPIGTGPFKLQHWLHDSETVFVRNPYAWRQPHIARIDVHTIFNDQSELDAMANGSADLIDDLSSIQYRQLQQIAPNVGLQTFASLYVDVITPNVRRPGLDDAVVRRAMMYGQDRAAVVRGLFYGKVPVPDNLVPMGLTHWHTNQVRQYHYDPVRARAMLDADGWRVGPDGVRSRNGKRLAFEMLLNQGSAIYTDLMIEFIADMKAIGIDISLRQLDFPSILSRGFAGKFDLIAEGWGGTVDPDQTNNLATSQAPPAGQNLGGFSDSRLDRLMQRGLTELDDAKRRALYDDMQREIAEQVPVFYLFGRFAADATSPRLRLDPKVTLQSPLLYYNVEDWKTSG